MLQRHALRTSPATFARPWECVWRQGDGLRCYVGRIFDMDVAVGGPQFVQYRFSQPKPSILTLGERPVTNLSTQGIGSNPSGNYGVKTGSCVVHQKSSFGRTTWSEGTSVNPNLGYAFWPQGIWGGQGDAVYVILHKEEAPPEQNDVARWCVSLVAEADLVPEDIRLAVVISTKCVQIWQSDVYYAVGGGGPTTHPFMVEGSVNQNDEVELTIHDGHVNNVTLDNYMVNNQKVIKTISGAGTYRVYIVVNKVSTTYPSTVEWEVTAANAQVPANDDTKSHVLLAVVIVTVNNNVTSFEISQLVSTSLNTVRVKYGPATNEQYYLFNRV